MEQWRKAEEIYKGKTFSVIKGDVQLFDYDGELITNKLYPREIVRRCEAVGIVPYDQNNGMIYLCRQYRIAIDQEVTEIPAGKIEVNDYSPINRAQTELVEELGITAETWINLGEFYPSVGYTTEKIHLFACTDLTHGASRCEEDERIGMCPMKINEVKECLKSYYFKDSKTIIALERFFKRENLLT